VTDTSATQRASAPQDIAGWAGWVVFAGIMLILLGAFQAIEGLVAVFDQGYYLVGPEGLVVNIDYTAWGWVHLILGIVAVAAGIGLIMGNSAARIVGVGLAVLSAILNLAFLAAYPVWSIIIIALDIVIIYAIRPWPSAQEMTRATGPTDIGSSRGECPAKNTQRSSVTAASALLRTYVRLRASPSTVDLTGVGRRVTGEQGWMEERHAALTA